MVGKDVREQRSGSGVGVQRGAGWRQRFMQWGMAPKIDAGGSEEEEGVLDKPSLGRGCVASSPRGRRAGGPSWLSALALTPPCHGPPPDIPGSPPCNQCGARECAQIAADELWRTSVHPHGSGDPITDSHQGGELQGIRCQVMSNRSCTESVIGSPVLLCSVEKSDQKD